MLDAKQKRKWELLALSPPDGGKVGDMVQKLDGENSGTKGGALPLISKRDPKRSKKGENSARSLSNE